MKSIRRAGQRLRADVRGLETIEYAVMMALIVAALVVAAVLLGEAISGRFESVADLID